MESQTEMFGFFVMPFYAIIFWLYAGNAYLRFTFTDTTEIKSSSLPNSATSAPPKGKISRRYISNVNVSYKTL